MIWPCVRLPAAGPNRSLLKDPATRSVQPGPWQKGLENGKKASGSKSFLLPIFQFFEIHVDEFKPHSVCHLGQTSVRCVPSVIRQFSIVLPDVPLHRFYTVPGVQDEGHHGKADVNVTYRCIRVAQRVLRGGKAR